MKLIWSILVLFFFESFAAHQDSTPEWKEYARLLQQLEDELSEEIAHRDNRAVGTEYFDVKFTSPPEAITVHSLRPENIDVVAALGDSITAGTGIDAETIAGIAVQWRGLTWTAGGDEDLMTSLTIPNILRSFNPEVKGHSIGTKTDFDILEQDWFNVAVPGARANDMTQQAEWLIERMKNDNRTSYENDWKLISIFIGGNDLCALGRDPDGASPESYRDEVKSALDLMHKEIPRALVQIVQIMEIYLLPNVSSGYMAPPTCRIVQQVVCGHVVDSVEDEEMLEELKENNWRYQQLIEELIGSGEYDTRDDFTVVIQPFFKDTRLPVTESGQVDATFFAPDCFHFSSKGHAMGALNVWNNMLEPEGTKSTIWDVKDLSCPTEKHPYIFTRLNSKPDDEKRNVMKRSANTQEEGPGVQWDVSNNQKNARNTPRKEEVICPEVNCKTTPDWAIGVLSALVAVAGLQLLVILCVMKKGRKGYDMQAVGSHYSYSL